MNEMTEVLVDMYRLFGMFERDAVCCGTVTVPQCAALQLLLAEPREIGWMADRMGVSQSAMTRLIDGLERRAWLERRRDKKDRRKVTAVLTDEGTAQAETLKNLSQQAVAQVLGRIAPNKHAQILESFQLVHQALVEVRGSQNQDGDSCCG